MHLLGLTLTMKGGGSSDNNPSINEESVDEPPEDDGDLEELDDLYYSFEIITEEEIAALSCPFSTSLTSSSSSSSISSQGSSSSLGSTGTGPPTVIQAHKRQSQSNIPCKTILTEDELTASTRIWLYYQVKGHYNPDDDCLFKDMTTEETSMKWTGWFYNLRHLPEKLRQHAADKNRFNINAIPEEAREQLKHLYVY